MIWLRSPARLAERSPSALFGTPARSWISMTSLRPSISNCGLSRSAGLPPIVSGLQSGTTMRVATTSGELFGARTVILAGWVAAARRAGPQGWSTHLRAEPLQTGARVAADYAIDVVARRP